MPGSSPAPAGRIRKEPRSPGVGSPAGKGSGSLVQPYVSCERLDPHVRRGILRRLQDVFKAGSRDPELLYLGGRYAASLGLPDEARQFLDPLEKTVQDGQGASQTTLPLSLLNLHVLPTGELRDSTLTEAWARVEDSPELGKILCLLHGESDASLLDGSPREILLRIRNTGVDFGLALSAEPVRGCEPGGACRLVGLARAASQSYLSGDTAGARHSLEKILLQDGDQPDVLRNLITVTSEQGDIEANHRYWRRYVKQLLWRVMRGDDGPAAWNDLTRFYTQVAMATDREFIDAGVKAADKLRRPGLLNRWVESHVALVWLDSAVRPYHQQRAGLGKEQLARGRHGYLSMMRGWLRAFYPEYAPYLDISAPQQHWVLPLGTAARRNKFDPARVLLTRFVEWSKAQFGLRGEGDEHLDAVIVLAESAARLPAHAYVKDLEAKLRADKFQRQPFHQTMQEAYQIPLRIRLERLLEKQEWRELLEFAEDVDVVGVLSPMLRLLVAFALCQADKPSHGLNLALEALPEAKAEDFGEESQGRVLLSNVLRANAAAILNREKVDAGPELQRMRLRVEVAIGTADSLVRAWCKAELDAAEKNLHVSQTIEESRRLVGEGKFKEARNLIRRLPDTPEDTAKLKTDLLGQIDQAQEQSRVHEQIEKSIKQSKALVGQGKFEQARKLIRKLPDTPEDLVKLKTDLLGQINEAQEQSKVHEQVEKSVKQSKTLVGQGRFEEARKLIQKLPGTPRELLDLKKNLLSQINEAQEQSKVHGQIEKVVKQSRTLVGQGKFKDARKSIRSLPDTPRDLVDLKKNLLGQVDEVEAGQQRVSEENAQLTKELTRRGVDLSTIHELAKMNNLDISDPNALNALLQAIKQH